MGTPERNVGNERIAGWRLTEVPSLYGLVVREHGELIEYVSFAEARRRLETSQKGTLNASKSKS